MTENTVVVLKPIVAGTSPLALVEQWLEQSIDVLTPATRRRYRSAVHHFLAWFAQVEGHSLTLADLHPITIVGYRGTLQDARPTSTVNTHLCALRKWMAWLMEDGRLTANPAARLKLVSSQQAAAPRALTAAQVNALLRQTKQTRNPNRNAGIVQVLIQTGMRIGECVSLHWDDIHLGERQGNVRIRAGKGNKERVVPLNESARQALAEYAAPVLNTEPTLKAVAAAWPHAAKTPFWRSERGTPLSLREASRMVRPGAVLCLAQPCTCRGNHTQPAAHLRHPLPGCASARLGWPGATFGPQRPRHHPDLCQAHCGGTGRTGSSHRPERLRSLSRGTILRGFASPLQEGQYGS